MLWFDDVHIDHSWPLTFVLAKTSRECENMLMLTHSHLSSGFFAKLWSINLILPMAPEVMLMLVNQRCSVMNWTRTAATYQWASLYPCEKSPPKWGGSIWRNLKIWRQRQVSRNTDVTLVSLEFFSSSLADGPSIISSIFPATPGHWGQNKATGTTQPWTPKPERKQIVETENQPWKHHIIHSCFGNTLIPSNSTDFMGISTSYILTCLYLSFSSPCLLCGATWRRRLRRHLGKNMFASLASHHCLVSETNGRKIANCLAWISGSFLKILGYSIYV